MVLQDVQTRNNFAGLQRYADRHELSIDVIDVVPNMLPLPWGGTAVCRHLVELWMQDGKVIQDRGKTLACLTMARLGELHEQSLKIGDQGAKANVVAKSRFGKWLDNVLPQLPVNVAEEPIYACSRGHVMGMKIRKLVHQVTPSAIEIEVYDPGLGMVLTCTGKSNHNFEGLMMEFVFPRLHRYFYPGRDIALTIIWPNRKTNPSANYYIHWNNDLQHAEIFGQAIQLGQLELVSDMIDNIKATKSTADARRLLHATILMDGNNPLCDLADFPSGGTAMYKIMELMHWAEMDPKEAVRFLITKSPLQVPIAGYAVGKGNAASSQALLRGLKTLNIREKLAFEVLDARKDEGASGTAGALSSGHTQTLDILIDGLIDLGVTGPLAYQLFDATRNDGFNPMATCLAFGHADTLELLLKRLPELGIDQNQLYEMLKRQQFGNGSSGLGFAMEFGHTRTVDILLRGLADFGFLKEQTLSLLNQAAHHGWTPLGLMLQFRRDETLKVVLRHLPMLDILGEDALTVWIHAKADNNEAALLWLCEQGNVKTLEILLKGLPDLGIDDEQARKLLEVRNSNGQNAIDIARQAGHQDIVKLFETYLSS